MNSAKYLDNTLLQTSLSVGPDTGLSADAPKPRRKILVNTVRRRRLIRTCVNCHRRKVKCDKSVPACNNCVKLDFQCRYFDSVGAEIDAETSNGPDVTDQDGMSVSDDSQEKVVADVTELKTEDVRCSAATGRNTGYLSVDSVSGSTRYATGAFWASYFKELADVPSLLRSRNDAFNADVIAQDESSSAFLLAQLSSSPNAALQILHSLVPDRNISDILVTRYFLAIHPTVPILSRRRFFESYEAFWAAFSTKMPIDRNFLSLLFVTYYSAMLSICDSTMFDVFDSPTEIITIHDIRERQKEKQNTLKDLSVLQNKFRLATRISLAACNFPSRTSLSCLQASVILNSCSGAHNSDEGTGSVAMLIRVCQMMGLHRDPSNFPGQFNAEEAQARRLVWWQLVHLDYVVSMSQGLPPIYHRLESDVQLPSEHVIFGNEEYKDQFDPLILVMNAVSEASRLNCNILLAVYGVQKCDIGQIQKLDREIIELRPRIEERLSKLMTLKGDDIQVNTFIDWSTNLIHAVRQKAYTYLHHPNYLKDGEVGSKLKGTNRPSVRNNVLKMALNVLHNYLGLTKMPDNLIFISYVRPIQPFHAIIIVLQDLYLNPPIIPTPGSTFIEDERLRTVEQVFQVVHFLKIWELSAAVRNMWHMLNKLRTGAWLKIGYLHPIGLPLISTVLPPEYRDLVPQVEPSESGVIGVQALVELLTGRGNTDETNRLNGLPQEQLPTASNFDATSGVSAFGLRNASSDSSNMPMSFSTVESVSQIPPASDNSQPMTDGMFGLDPNLGIDNPEELHNFAAKMENFEIWDTWDFLIKS